MLPKYLLGHFFWMTLLFIPSVIKAEDNASDTTADEARSILSLGTSYYTNTISFGTINSLIVEPSYSVNLSYYGKKGVFLSAAALLIGNSDSTSSHTTSEYDLGIGYQLNFLKYFTITPSFIHYFYSKSSNSFKSGVNNSLLLDVNANVKWWSIGVNGGYSWGKIEDFYTSVTTNAVITFNNVFSKGNTLTIQPTGALNFGNWNYYNFYGARAYRFLSNFAENHPNITAGQLIDFYNSNSKLPVVQRMKDNAVLYKRVKKLSSNQNLADLFKKNPQFTLSSFTLSLPVSYSIKDLTINLGVSAGKPLNEPRYISSDWVTYFSFGLIYSFNF